MLPTPSLWSLETVKAFSSDACTQPDSPPLYRYGILEMLDEVKVCVVSQNSTSSSYFTISLEVEGIEVGKDEKDFQRIFSECNDRCSAAREQHDVAVSALRREVDEATQMAHTPLQFVPLSADWEKTFGLSESLPAIQRAYQNCVKWKGRYFCECARATRMKEVRLLLCGGYCDGTDDEKSEKDEEEKGMNRIKDEEDNINNAKVEIKEEIRQEICAQEGDGQTLERVYTNVGLLLKTLCTFEFIPNISEILTFDVIRLFIIHFVVCGSQTTRLAVVPLIRKIFSSLPPDSSLSESIQSSTLNLNDIPSNNSVAQSTAKEISPQQPNDRPNEHEVDLKSAECAVSLPAALLNEFFSHKHITRMSVDCSVRAEVFYYNTAVLFYLIKDAVRVCNVKWTLQIMNEILLLFQSTSER
jgi:hypothetical protein